LTSYILQTSLNFAWQGFTVTVSPGSSSSIVMMAAVAVAVVVLVASPQAIQRCHSLRKLSLNGLLIVISSG